VRWYVAYPLSLRHIEEMMQERGVFWDHVTVHRWAIKVPPVHDVPGKITIDKSGANTAAIESVKADACIDILMRQNKYLNNIVEQDHRAIKLISRVRSRPVPWTGILIR
jgi:transposase-like protein